MVVYMHDTTGISKSMTKTLEELKMATFLFMISQFLKKMFEISFNIHS